MTPHTVTPNVAMLLRQVVETLPRYSYRYSDESTLHDGIRVVLMQAGIEFIHECVAGPKDRFDFFLPPGIVIEAKVKGSLSDALRQVDRYSQRDDVHAIVLVTSRTWGRSPALVPELRGKQLRVVTLRGAAF